MGYQSEAALENQLIKQLEGLNYTRVTVNSEASVLSNLKSRSF